MTLRSIFAALAFLLPLLAAQDACAQDYAKPTWPNLLRTMVRFNAIDISDRTLLDEYTIVNECSLYKSFYNNDFKWDQVRQAMLKSIKNEVATFPMSYYHEAALKLDRYDFDTKTFKFSSKSNLRNINTFNIYSVSGDDCGEAKLMTVPRNFRAVLDTPLTLDGLPLSEQDARALLKKMDADKNTERVIYARFNLRIVYIEAFRKTIGANYKGENKSQYEQGKSSENGNLRLDARLDSISFYADREMTQIIFQYAGS